MPNLWKGASRYPSPLRSLQVKLRFPAPPPEASPEFLPKVTKKTIPPATKPVGNRPESRQVLQPAPEKLSVAGDTQKPPPPAEVAAMPRPQQSTPLPNAPSAQSAAVSIPGRVAAQADQDALDGYGRALSKTFSKYQRYPRLAQMRRWQGKVQVSLQIAAGGKLISASVSRSSGYEILDQQALEIIRQADPLPPVPEALQAKTFIVVVPILFKLENS